MLLHLLGRATLFTSFLVALPLLLAACAPAVQPTPAPPKPTAAPAPAKPALSPDKVRGEGAAPSPAAAKPAPSPAAKAPFDTNAWQAVVAAAKQEGKIVVYGPQGIEARDVLVDGFQNRYRDIQVDFTAQSPATYAPRVLQELGAGQHLTDLLIIGTTQVLGTLIPAGALEPIKPFLAGPENLDASKWRDGKFDFSDEAEIYNLVFVNRLQPAFIYNSGMVSPAEFTSWKDLLQPKWKDKMAMLGTLSSGGGQSVAAFWYSHTDLGKPFVEEIFTKQNVVFSRDDRQILDWAARGEKPIAIGVNFPLALEMKEKGLPVDIMGAEGLREGSYVSASNGTAGVVKSPPHPNAIKVYLDYLLSREAQLAWSKATGVASLRRDVPTDHLLPFLVPKEGAKYLAEYKEGPHKARGELVEFLRTIVPS